MKQGRRNKTGRKIFPIPHPFDHRTVASISNECPVDLLRLPGTSSLSYHPCTAPPWKIFCADGQDFVGFIGLHDLVYARVVLIVLPGQEMLASGHDWPADCGLAA